ncbi:hypothetical protein CMI38_02665, partial [Candidatus Pacearchaeota archaeon]|nr:hypothetical protein [Candidatus Pacearchaeota archaeon]
MGTVMVDDEILKKIKDHKKYVGIADSVVKREIGEVLRIDSRIGSDGLVKEVRKRLHRLYSSYQTGRKGKRDGYLEGLKDWVAGKNDNGDVCDDLLSITLSTKERLKDYSEIYSKIFSITGKPERIVDLGCGMNPLSFPLMG